MELIFRNPPAILRPFIDQLWHVSGDEFNQQDLGLPVMRHELMFNFSEQFAVTDVHDQTLIINKESWLNGIYTRPQRSTTQGRHETFGVFLKPWALYSLTNIPASELTNQVVDGPTIFRQSIAETTDFVRDLVSADDKLAGVEQFLIKHLASKDVPAYIPYAVAYLQNRPWHDGIIRELAAKLRRTPKSLTVAFKKYIGISPGRFLHLRLLNEVATDLARNPQQSLTELAYHHRFFDQAHLNHLFKSLTNLTPGTYRNRVLAGDVDQTDPCFIRENTA
ncbi:helix-turn-helix domain-containing protein [Tellurirhabdus bombi]|uniref:helix-turn-helix domain-containing protein n=1 Tax=Tellurirhabdus bombi TaxID=2907205 RepID=UPI001F3AC1FF|nr:helix-turn-helix domain-containing protein [Tellurirhabdus bombi]